MAARGLVAATAAGLLLALPCAAQASFGVEAKNWEAGTCNSETCTYESVEKNHGEAYTQSSGHPPYGLTTFEVNSKKGGLLGKEREPEGALKRVRVDVPPGLAANPNATVQCPVAVFDAPETIEGKNNCETSYPGSRVGTNKAEIFVGALGIDDSAEAPVFNLQQPAGEAQDFGIYFGEAKQRLFLIGHVSWHRERILEERGIPSGDYHEWFEIANVPKEGEIKGVKTELITLKSKLIFFGTAGKGDYLTLPTTCSTVETNYLEVESWEGQVSTTATNPPVGVEGCNNDPFGPKLEVGPEAGASGSDQPDGATTTVEEPQKEAASEVDTADIENARVTLPEGLTLNPSAAHGLEACSPAQIAIGSEAPVSCPAGSQVGEVAIYSNLPEPLTGPVYLGDPKGLPITKPPYTIYVDAESNYGVAVRLEGEVEPNPETGRLEVSFLKNPQLTFSRFVLKSKGGPQAPLANPLVCGSALAQSLFTPYTGLGAATSNAAFVTGGCPSSLAFALTQSAPATPATAGAHGSTSYTLNLARADGQQYLSTIKTVLPAGLVGAIPDVTLCGEPQASQGTCPAASQIGTATVSAGAGSDPYTFSGPVFMTGPYAGAPYGLSVAVPAVAGPFNLGTVVTRATINVEMYSGRVVATSTVPRIVGGVPLRLRSISVDVNRPNFLYNPTNCGALATESTLTSTFGATQSLSSPFQVGACNALAFKPSYTANTTGAKLTRPQGASIEVKLTQPAGQANIRYVQMQLPKQLVARGSTLQKACTAAEFEKGPPPGVCKSTAKVGEVVATTPVLPGQLKGPVYYVSHGAEAFPDLDLVLEGDGVEVVLVGHTHIAHSSITTSTFETLPDVPVSNVTVKLPIGPNSALSSNGRLCGANLIAPTTIIAQSGTKITQSTKIAVTHCPIRVISHKVRGSRLVLTVWAPEAGRLRITGKGIRRVKARVRKAGRVKVSIPLSHSLRAALKSKHGRKLKLRIGFTPHSGHNTSKVKLSLR